MPVVLHDIPEDWICKSCLSSGTVLPEVGGKDITMRTMTIDCSEMATAGLSFFFLFLNEILSLNNQERCLN